MPPKKEERKPLLPIFTIDQVFYEHRHYDPEQISQFLTYFKPDLPLKNNIYANMQMLSNAIGVHIHPAFKIPEPTVQMDFDENAKFRNEDDPPEIKEVVHVSITSQKVDICTLKLLEFCAAASGISVLKLCNNDLSPEEQTTLGQIIMSPECFIKKLYIDWNIVSDQLLKTIGSSNIEFLTLRSCHLQDSAIEALCSNIKQLKCLDLYNNNLSKKSLALIGAMIQTNTSIEFLGLAKNNISSFEELQPIVGNLGKFLLSPEELEEYRFKEKERDAVVERNKKVKKKGTEEPVPVLEAIQQIDQFFYIVRNSRLWLLNLSMNNIDDNSRDAIEKVLTSTGDQFQLVLTSNKLEDQKQIQRIKKKFVKKLII